MAEEGPAPHSRFDTQLAGWVREEVDEALPDTRAEFFAAPSVHPAVPPPHLVLLIYVQVPSLANLGRNVAHAGMLLLQDAHEMPVRTMTRQICLTVRTQQREQLTQANGDGGNGAAAPVFPPGAGPFQWPPK